MGRGEGKNAFGGEANNLLEIGAMKQFESDSLRRNKARVKIGAMAAEVCVVSEGSHAHVRIEFLGFVARNVVW